MKNGTVTKKIKAALALLTAFMFAFAPGALFGASAEAASGKWVTTWATSLVNGSIELGSVIPGVAVQDVIPSKSTIRTELSVTTGGKKLRFKFSNQFGKSAITISEASVARTSDSGKAAIVDGTQTPILFNRQTSATIAPGETLWSDSVSFETKALEKISISGYFRNLTYITTTGLSNGRTYMSTGLLMSGSNASRVNYTSLPASNEINITSGTVTYHTIPFLADIETYSSDASACTAVFIGDSTLVNDTYLHYAKRLVSGGCTNVAVVNEAVIGNKLLSDGTGLIGNLCGKAMLDRFTRDVLSLPGVKYCFVKIGLNDIAHQYSKSLSPTTPKYTPQDIIAGYKTLVSLCHARGIKIYFFTKSPWKGYEREFLGQSGDLTWSLEIQKLCDELTNWVKTNKEADGYIDCAELANPADTYALCPSFTPDGAHLTELGSIALADLIPVEFVGANASKCKTAASIAGVDPYKEKKQIIKKMNAEKTTSPAEEPTSRGNSGTVTPPADEATLPAEVTEPVTEPVTSPDYTIPAFEEPTTAALTPVNGDKTNGNQSGKNNTPNNPNYNVIDINSIGTGGGSIAFILILVTAVIGSGIAVVLTMTRRREEAE